MTFADLQLNPTPKTLRQFSAAWLVFFLAAAAQQYFRRGHPHVGLALAIAAISIGVLGLAKPAAVRWLFVASMFLAFPIGWIVSQMMLLLMFYLVVTPVALLLRIRGRDALRRRPARNATSFWQPKETPEDVTSYFRQY
jgi:hypothetical protein